ncbi:sulfatase-like hydrolase/transferase [Altererythrobacter salegens]|uniref:Sulfatase-like hydrolase/transferase n=1 Tax=Croceibacterium salegens TaxID=1737568 RepID=A0A6I4T1Z8_9SPHN|nr:sulfatase [Croceibacterium salegens]MXO61336.1 sulfatase-like hydrolase/transferase [Croceibacterium salegens]
MMRVKKWLKRLGLIFALPAVLVLALALWASARLLLYDQVDDEAHLAEKQDYLEQLRILSSSVDMRDRTTRPNIVFILYDDLGYGDLGAFGAEAIKTPNIDALAATGIRLTQFYSPSPVCTPSRAGFLTGRMPPRAGLSNVVHPEGSAFDAVVKIEGQNVRLPVEEITIADMLSAAGYRTAMIGKWHLGDVSPSLPNEFGFESFFGSLYSNDMEPFALYRDGKIEVEAPVDQAGLNARYTQEAVDFIRREADSGQAPFFLYFAHNFPHVPQYVEADREGRSEAGLYGDVVEALDDGVGQIVGALDEAGALGDTIIVITSDNGPWWQGDPSSLRGRKGDTYEGGMRVPFIVHWPGRLEGGREATGMAMGIDLLPTFADWLHLPLPADRMIDGRSMASMLEDGAGTPHDYLFYFAVDDVLAVRNTKHKLIGVHNATYGPMNVPIAISSAQGPWLINLELDPREAYDTSLHDPGLARVMADVLEAKRTEMEANPRGWIEH